MSLPSELLRQLNAAPEAAQWQYRDRLAQLAAMFPDSGEQTLGEILRNVDGDLERAVVVMFSPLSPYHKKPALPTPVERPPAPDFTYTSNPWLAGMPPTPPAPVAPVTPPQLSPRAKALSVVIAAPSPALPKREDTPMEDVVAAPDLVAPPPEDPDSKPGSPIAPWNPTLEDANTQRDVVYLHQVFLGISDEFVLHTMEEGGGDPAATITWAAAISNANRVLGVISDAFPTAAPGEVQKALLAKNGSATTAYTLLSRQHESMWDREHFTLSSQIAQKLLPADNGLTPKFCDPDPSYAWHEVKWWETMVATKAYKVAGSTQDTAAWSTVTLLASTTVDITPRVAGHMESLGAWHTNKVAFNQAMRALRVFHVFSSLTRHCATNPKQAGSTLNVILALMEDGLASPGATTWAVEHLTKSPQAYQAARFYFAAYGANCHTLWN